MDGGAVRPDGDVGVVRVPKNSSLSSPQSGKNLDATKGRVRSGDVMSREILKKVLSLVRKGWTTSGPARNKAGHRVDVNAIDACSWSLFGAFAAASKPISEEWRQAVRVLMAAAKCEKEVELLDWSEAGARTQEEVVAVLEKSLRG